MTAVVTDTTPVHYLVLAGAIGILPVLFERVFMPPAVRDELLAEGAPRAVRAWMSQDHPWLHITAPKQPGCFPGLDAGESEAIALAGELSIRALLMDEKRGRLAVQQRGLIPIGTLELLNQADARGICRFEDALQVLRQHRFRAGSKLVLTFLEQVRNRRASSVSHQQPPPSPESP